MRVCYYILYFRKLCKKSSCVLDFKDFLTAISHGFRVRGPLLERVPVHAPEHRGHAFILKNACASFGKNRKSVTKAQKAPD